MTQINTWPGWECVRQIGEGSFGRVYEIRRQEYGKTFSAALKVITIPQNPSEIDTAKSEGMDQKSITEYFHTIVEEIAREFAIMSDLKGHSNIVSYEDHAVIAHEDGIGWDILVRMELLTPLLEYEKQHPFSEKMILKLGCDICRALEICDTRDIIHRDIKPENIFVNGDKDFKLGDFGIARTTEKTVSNLSKKGTYTYMAPEVYLGKPYGKTVDIYSLGMVLYRFLNCNRTAFLPLEGIIRFGDREEALMRRMRGEPIPEPAGGSDEIKRIVLKALSYKPDDRYQSATELLIDLQKCMFLESDLEKATILLQKPSSSESGNPNQKPDSYETINPRQESVASESTGGSKERMVFPDRDRHIETKEKGKSKLPILVGILGLLIVGLVGCIIMNIKKKDATFDDNNGVTATENTQEQTSAEELVNTQDTKSDNSDQLSENRKALKYVYDGQYEFSEFDNAGLCTKMTRYSCSGKVLYWYEYKYDDRGFVSVGTRYDADGKENGWIEYECDKDGKKVSSSRFNKKGKLAYTREHIYQGTDFETEIRRYSPDGTLMQDAFYNLDGVETECRIYENGNTLIYTEELDNHGNQIKEVLTDQHGNIIKWYTCSYDEDGLRTEMTCYHGDDTLDYHLEFVPNILECTKASITMYDQNGDIKQKTEVSDPADLPAPEDD